MPPRRRQKRTGHPTKTPTNDGPKKKSSTPDKQAPVNSKRVHGKSTVGCCCDYAGGFRTDFSCSQVDASAFSAVNGGFIKLGLRWTKPPMQLALTKEVWVETSKAKHGSHSTYEQRLQRLKAKGGGASIRLARHHIKEEFWANSKTDLPQDGKPNMKKMAEHLNNSHRDGVSSIFRSSTELKGLYPEQYPSPMRTTSTSRGSVEASLSRMSIDTEGAGAGAGVAPRKDLFVECGSSSSDEEKTVAKDLSAALEKIRLLEITVEEEKKKAKARKLMDSEWLRNHCTDAQCSRLTSLPTVKSFFAFHKYLTADGLFGLSVMPPRLADLDDDDDDDDGDLGDSDVGSVYDGASPNFSADSGSDDGADADAGADAGAGAGAGVEILHDPVCVVAAAAAGAAERRRGLRSAGKT